MNQLTGKCVQFAVSVALLEAANKFGNHCKIVLISLYLSSIVSSMKDSNPQYLAFEQVLSESSYEDL